MFELLKNKKLLIVTFVMIMCNLYSQKSKLFYIQPNYHYGFFIENSKINNDIFPDNYYALDFKIGVQTKGENWWHKNFNYPSYGVGFYKSFSNNYSVFGSPFAIYAFFEGTLFKIKKISFNYDYGAGVGYLNKHYNKYNNPKNDIASTYINYFLNIKLSLNYKISERFNASIGAHFSHFSNGALQMPNFGLNMYGINTGLKYYFNSKNTSNKFIRKKIKTEINIAELKKNIFTLSLGFGACRETYNKQSPLYSVYTAVFNYNRRYTNITSYGVGLDAFYNGSVVTHKGYYDYKNLEIVFYGVHLSHVIHINKLDFISDLGTYINDRNLKGFIWARLGYRYNITNYMFTQISFKTQNGAKADFIEFVIGAKL